MYLCLRSARARSTFSTDCDRARAAVFVDCALFEFEFEFRPGFSALQFLSTTAVDIFVDRVQKEIRIKRRIKSWKNLKKFFLLRFHFIFVLINKCLRI